MVYKTTRIRSVSRFVKKTTPSNGRYIKEVPLSSVMLYKRLRVEPRDRALMNYCRVAPNPQPSCPYFLNCFGLSLNEMIDQQY